jgi:hypothetical protein
VLKKIPSVPPWLFWILLVVVAVSTWVIVSLPLRGPWGEFWGIDEEGWASVWATVLSAAIAATVAILVLRKQSAAQAATAKSDRDHAAQQAAKDRHHQSELARVERDIASTIALHAVLIDYLDKQEESFRTFPKNSYSLISHADENRKQFENALEHWAMNCGMTPGETLHVKNIIKRLATQYIFWPGPGQVTLRGDYRNFLREMFDDLFMTISTPPDTRYIALAFRLKKYDEDIEVRDRKMYDAASAEDASK